VSAPAAPSASERFVDLHSHSTASDGALPPTAVVEAAVEAKLAVLALTDHDTMAGVAEAQAAGDRLGVRVVAGVELSALHLEREIHMLALHVERSDELESQLAGFRDGRVRRAEQMVAKLRELGAPITMDAVMAHAGRGAVGRPHVARALVDSGFVRDQREAFDRYIGNGRPALVAKEALYAADAIDLVHAAGGIAGVRAPRPRRHPRHDRAARRVRPSTGSRSCTRARAARTWRASAPSPTTSISSRAAGSDWHGTTDGFRTLGQMRVPYAVLEQQEERAARRRAERRVA
jgi:predicted metal-dependent phosphoesterase TrpH